MKGKKITEKMLLDGYEGMDAGFDNISTVNGIRVWWVYRRHTEDCSPMVESREDAEFITLEYNRSGRISLDPDCENHPTLEEMRTNLECIYGTMVPSF